MEEHPAHRAALALAPVLAAAGRLLCEPALLQHVAHQGVGELETVLLGGELVEVSDGEVGIELLAQAAQLLDHLFWNAQGLAAAGPVVPKPLLSEGLVTLPQPPEVARREPADS